MNKSSAVVFGVFGLFIMIYGILRAVVLRIVPWYAYFVVGGTLFFGWVNYLLKNKSLFWKFERDKVFVLKSFLYYFIFGVVIEFAGQYLFGFWSYPDFSFYEQMVWVFILTYSFAFFFFYEFFVLFKGFVKNPGHTFVLVTLILSFSHEILNTFVSEWVYTIPFVTLEVLGINIVVILGWSVLVAIPLIVRRMIEEEI